jgi:hypothetical protein
MHLVGLVFFSVGVCVQKWILLIDEVELVIILDALHLVKLSVDDVS